MNWLKITTGSEIIRIPTDEIVFIQGDGNYSNIYLCSGKEENITGQLHVVMDKLAAQEKLAVLQSGQEFYRQQKLYLQS